MVADLSGAIVSKPQVSAAALGALMAGGPQRHFSGHAHSPSPATSPALGEGLRALPKKFLIQQIEAQASVTPQQCCVEQAAPALSRPPIGHIETPPGPLGQQPRGQPLTQAPAPTETSSARDGVPPASLARSLALGPLLRPLSALSSQRCPVESRGRCRPLPRGDRKRLFRKQQILSSRPAESS